MIVRTFRETEKIPTSLNKMREFPLEHGKILFYYYISKFKGPCKSFGYWGLKLLPGIRVIADGLDLRPRPEP